MEKGYDVRLLTLDMVRWDLVENLFEGLRRPTDEYYVFNQLPNYRPEAINWFLMGVSYLYLLLRAQKIPESVNINNYGEIYPFISDLCYFNSVPLFVLCNDPTSNPFQIRNWALLSKIYYITFRMIRFFFKESSFLTNSKFNASQIRSLYRSNILVIHPPVKTMKNDVSKVLKSKRDVILTVSRISVKKNLEIILKIANLLRDEKFQFIIAGHINEQQDYNELSMKLIESGLDNVQIIINPSRKKIFDLMRISSIYLSTQTTEAFGMSIVEAMSRGSIPLVQKSGGPWTDILAEKNGQYGYSYKSAVQAAKKIRYLLTHENDKQKITLKAFERSKKFDETNFSRRLVQLVGKFSRHRRG